MKLCRDTKAIESGLNWCQGERCSSLRRWGRVFHVCTECRSFSWLHLRAKLWWGVEMVEEQEELVVEAGAGCQRKPWGSTAACSWLTPVRSRPEDLRYASRLDGFSVRPLMTYSRVWFSCPVQHSILQNVCWKDLGRPVVMAAALRHKILPRATFQSGLLTGTVRFLRPLPSLSCGEYILHFCFSYPLKIYVFILPFFCAFLVFHIL